MTRGWYGREIELPDIKPAEARREREVGDGLCRLRRRRQRDAVSFRSDGALIACLSYAALLFRALARSRPLRKKGPGIIEW